MLANHLGTCVDVNLPSLSPLSEFRPAASVEKATANRLTSVDKTQKDMFKKPCFSGSWVRGKCKLELKA